MIAVTRLLTGVLLRRPWNGNGFAQNWKNGESTRYSVLSTCHQDWPGEHCERRLVEGCRPLPEVVGLEAEKLARFVHAVVDLDGTSVRARS